MKGFKLWIQFSNKFWSFFLLSVSVSFIYMDRLIAINLFVISSLILCVVGLISCLHMCMLCFLSFTHSVLLSKIMESILQIFSKKVWIILNSPYLISASLIFIISFLCLFLYVLSFNFLIF